MFRNLGTFNKGALSIWKYVYFVLNKAKVASQYVCVDGGMTNTSNRSG